MSFPRISNEGIFSSPPSDKHRSNISAKPKERGEDDSIARETFKRNPRLERGLNHALKKQFLAGIYTGLSKGCVHTYGWSGARAAEPAGGAIVPSSS